MTLLRFVMVLLLVTCLAALLGGVAGALFDAGVPQQVQVAGETVATQPAGQSAGRPGGQPAPQRAASEDRSGQLGVEVQADRSPIITGAACGAGFGLLIGGPCGLLVALLDQGALLVRQKRGER